MVQNVILVQVRVGLSGDSSKACHQINKTHHKNYSSSAEQLAVGGSQLPSLSCRTTTLSSLTSTCTLEFLGSQQLASEDGQMICWDVFDDAATV